MESKQRPASQCCSAPVCAPAHLSIKPRLTLRSSRLNQVDLCRSTTLLAFALPVQQWAHHPFQTALHRLDHLPLARQPSETAPLPLLILEFNPPVRPPRSRSARQKGTREGHSKGKRLHSGHWSAMSGGRPREGLEEQRERAEPSTGTFRLKRNRRTGTCLEITMVERRTFPFIPFPRRRAILPLFFLPHLSTQQPSPCHRPHRHRR